MTAWGSTGEDGGVAEPQPDTVRLLLEGHRALATELLSSLEERGYPDARPARSRRGNSPDADSEISRSTDMTLLRVSVAAC